MTVQFPKRVGSGYPTLLCKLLAFRLVDFLLKFKIVATRCRILRLKCIKFDFGWGSAPDPAGRAHSAPPDPLTGFKGPTSKGREGKGKGRKG